MLNKYNLNLAQLASTEASRSALQGIFVTPNETVVTDGHQLTRVTTPDYALESFPQIAGINPTAEFKPFTMPTADALAAAKMLPAKTRIPVLNNAVLEVSTVNDAPAVKLGATDLDSPQVRNIKPVAGNFPDWERHMPKKEHATQAISFNVHLLMSVLKQFDTFTKGISGQQITLYLKDENSAIFIEANGGDGQLMQSAVMPCRGEAGTFMTARREELKRAAAEQEEMNRLCADELECSRRIYAEQHPDSEYAHVAA
jgi:hypothetical protein